jgi:lipopolysaccharide/colanic/teichoic acid biosynthesis glycosyltransferase
MRIGLRRAAQAERVLILGNVVSAAQIVAELENMPAGHSLLLLDGHHGSGGPKPQSGRNGGKVPVEGLPDAIADFRPDRVIVALSDAETVSSIRRVLATFPSPIVLETAAEAQQRLTGKVALEAVHPRTLDCVGSPSYRRLKRAFSLFTAAGALLVLAPLMVLIAVLIKLDSRGPVFFVQERVWLHGRRFRLFKFRSMLPDSRGTSEWARDNADRITRVGAWLRQYHLDELPQFLNILRGDMELVGPRPQPLSHHLLLEREIPHYALRYETVPGLTGWAQVRIGYTNDLAGEMEKMRYDLYYLTHQSLALDLAIVWETVKIVLLGRDPSRQPAARQPLGELPSSLLWRSNPDQ